MQTFLVDAMHLHHMRGEQTGRECWCIRPLLDEIRRGRDGRRAPCQPAGVARVGPSVMQVDRAKWLGIKCSRTFSSRRDRQPNSQQTTATLYTRHGICIQDTLRDGQP